MINMISLSGGKDSTALALHAIDLGATNLRFVFADTGHEHKQTYEYIEYLHQWLLAQTGQGIDTVKADFTERMLNKREYIQQHWPDDLKADALEVIKPSGNPFLDLCLWKGRFPSTRARFCSSELKHAPLNDYAMRALKGSEALISWQGVRRDESRSRANLIEKDVEFGTWTPAPSGLLIYRPLLDWSAEDCFAIHRRFGIKHNPLYEQGMGRVGCMPCIHVRKAELREIANRFPEEIERVKQWELLVSKASKRGLSLLLDVRNIKGSNEITPESHDIWQQVRWSKTLRGGVTPDPDADSSQTCSSLYGLCE